MYHTCRICTMYSLTTQNSKLNDFKVDADVTYGVLPLSYISFVLLQYYLNYYELPLKNFRREAKRRGGRVYHMDFFGTAVNTQLVTRL